MSSATSMKLGLLALFVPACSLGAVPAPAPAASAVPTPIAVAPAAATPVCASATVVTPVAPTPAARVDVPQRHATSLRVDRLVVARGVVGREPQGTDTLFAPDEKRLYAFVEVDNPEHAPGDVKVQFVQPNGTPEPAVDLAVGESPRWRTWAFTRHARAPGTWKAIVRDEQGHVLASTEFKVASS